MFLIPREFLKNALANMKENVGFYNAGQQVYNELFIDKSILKDDTLIEDKFVSLTRLRNKIKIQKDWISHVGDSVADIESNDGNVNAYVVTKHSLEYLISEYIKMFGKDSPILKEIRDLKPVVWEQTPSSLIGGGIKKRSPEQKLVAFLKKSNEQSTYLKFKSKRVISKKLRQRIAEINCNLASIPDKLVQLLDVENCLFSQVDYKPALNVQRNKNLVVKKAPLATPQKVLNIPSPFLKNGMRVLICDKNPNIACYPFSSFSDMEIHVVYQKVSLDYNDGPSSKESIPTEFCKSEFDNSQLENKRSFPSQKVRNSVCEMREKFFADGKKFYEHDSFESLTGQFDHCYFIASEYYNPDWFNYSKNHELMNLDSVKKIKTVIPYLRNGGSISSTIRVCLQNETILEIETVSQHFEKVWITIDNNFCKFPIEDGIYLSFKNKLDNIVDNPPFVSDRLGSRFRKHYLIKILKREAYYAKYLKMTDYVNEIINKQNTTIKRAKENKVTEIIEQAISSSSLFPLVNNYIQEILISNKTICRQIAKNLNVELYNEFDSEEMCIFHYSQPRGFYAEIPKIATMKKIGPETKNTIKSLDSFTKTAKESLYNLHIRDQSVINFIKSRESRYLQADIETATIDSLIKLNNCYFDKTKVLIIREPTSTNKIKEAPMIINLGNADVLECLKYSKIGSTLVYKLNLSSNDKLIHDFIYIATVIFDSVYIYKSPLSLFNLDYFVYCCIKNSVLVDSLEPADGYNLPLNTQILNILTRTSIDLTESAKRCIYFVDNLDLVNDKSQIIKTIKDVCKKNTEMANSIKSKLDLLNIFRIKITTFLFSELTLNNDDISPLFLRWYLLSKKKGILPKDFTIPEDFLIRNEKKFVSTLDKIKETIREINFWLRNELIKLPRIVPILELSNSQETKLKKLYTGDISKFQKVKEKLLAVHFAASGKMHKLSMQLGIPFGITKHADKIIELFGSPFTSAYPYYSPFLIDEKYFSSLGLVTECELNSNTLYVAFSENFSKKPILQVLEQLSNKPNVDIILIFPWNDDTKKDYYSLQGEVVLQSPHLKSPILQEDLVVPKYLVNEYLLDKDKYKYWNYSTSSYVSAFDSKLVIMSSGKREKDYLSELVARWELGDTMPDEHYYIGNERCEIVSCDTNEEFEKITNQAIKLVKKGVIYLHGSGSSLLNYGTVTINNKKHKVYKPVELSFDSLNPKVKTQQINNKNKSFTLICDHLLPGGTKQRGVNFNDIPVNDVMYAGPYIGYAQIAMAIGAKVYNKKATAVLSRNDYYPTLRAIQYGCKIKIIQNAGLEELQSEALDYAKIIKGFLLGFGFNSLEFIDTLYQNIISSLEGVIDAKNYLGTVWVAAGSGTLLSVLTKVFPKAKFGAVQVGKTVDLDFPNKNRVTLYIASEKFYQTAKYLPPYPSAPKYDAKVWQFVKDLGKDGDLIWNVAN